jgi:transposase
VVGIIDGTDFLATCESRIPSNRPLRLIRGVADEALTTLNDQFATLYSENSRPSILPEQLLCALLLQAFYSIRSERQLMEQLRDRPKIWGIMTIGTSRVCCRLGIHG